MRAVDLFAGWGGFTLGAELAGVDVVWAGNHWATAVRVHELNHPGTQHVCQDLQQADWTTLPDYELLLASPVCRPHSTASQPKRIPKHDQERATAWAIIDCAEVTMPTEVLVENVPAFARWKLFPVWLMALEALGYRVSTLLATDYGVPQRRKRLFVRASLTGGELSVPESSHEPAFGPCVDWEAPGWRDRSLASPGAQKRFSRAQANHGPRCLSQHVTGHPGVPLGEAIRTITTKDQWVLLDGDRYRPLTTREHARGMGFPEWFRWPPELPRKKVIKGLGNAVCPPQARDVILDVAA